MVVCIKCGKESETRLCDSCREKVDLEALCAEIAEYRIGNGGNELWDKIASDFYNVYDFKNIGFAIAEYLPSPRKEYWKILSLANNSCSVPKSSRSWLYETYNSCKQLAELSKMERNRIRGLVIDALYKDYEYTKADEMVSEMLEETDLPKEVYLTIADFFSITRRYNEADEILERVSKIFADDDDTIQRIETFIKKNKQYREKAEAGKQEYMPNPKENKEAVKQKYVDFLASIGIDLTGKSEKIPKPIPKEQYPKPVEIREANFDSFVAFDLETTGLDSSRDEIIEFGAIKVVDGRIVETREFTFQEFAKPFKKKIPEEVQKMTGITPDDVKDARRMWKVMPDFMEFVGDNILVSFNCMRFDSQFMVRAGRYSHIIIENKYFDVMKYAGKFQEELGLGNGKFSLGELTRKLHIENPNAHRALADAATTAKVYLKLKEMDKGAGTASVEDMLSDIENW